MVNDNRLVSDNFPDWRNFDDQTYATLPGIDIMRSRADPQPVDLTAAELPQTELPFNGTSGAIDLTQLWEDVGPISDEPDRCAACGKTGPRKRRQRHPTSRTGGTLHHGGAHGCKRRRR